MAISIDQFFRIWRFLRDNPTSIVKAKQEELTLQYTDPGNLIINNNTIEILGK